MIIRWILGLSLSLFGGFFAAKIVRDNLISFGNNPQRDQLTGAARVEGWKTGIIERFFFTIVVGLQYPGALPGMMMWLGLKLATNWNHPDFSQNREARTRAFIALLVGLVSMSFALIGGVVCASSIHNP